LDGIKRSLPLSTGVSARAAVKNFDELPESKKKELQKLEAACNDFESIFVYQMMKEMKKTVHKTGLVSGGQAEDIFSDMLDQERAKQSPIGMGQILFKELSRSILPPPRKRG
jgi:flagellar protein FlgJ